MDMENFFRGFVIVYSVLFAAVGFVGRTLLFRRANGGKNPIIVGSPETAHGYTGRIGQYTVLLTAVTVISYATSPDGMYRRLIPFDLPAELRWAGVGILLVALVLTAVAQGQMGTSWRVGIETAERTAIVRHGLYRFSRNPIYLAIQLGNLGLFLVMPCVATLFVLALGYFTFQILIRLEEAHMRRLHGAEFDGYCKRVRRWI